MKFLKATPTLAAAILSILLGLGIIQPIAPRAPIPVVVVADRDREDVAPPCENEKSSSRLTAVVVIPIVLFFVLLVMIMIITTWREVNK